MITGSNEEHAMTMLATGTARIARAPGRDWDGVQFRTILLLCLPLQLAAAAAARLTPGVRSDARASLFAEAWRAAGTTARIALSG